MLLLIDLEGGEFPLVVSMPSSSSMTSSSLSLILRRFSMSSSIKFWEAMPASIPVSMLIDFNKKMDYSQSLMAISTPLLSFREQVTRAKSIRPRRLSLLSWLRRDPELFLSANTEGEASSSSLSDSMIFWIIFFWCSMLCPFGTTIDLVPDGKLFYKLSPVSKLSWMVRLVPTPNLFSCSLCSMMTESWDSDFLRLLSSSKRTSMSFLLMST